MAPKDKARAAGVSASSFLDLKAELARKEAEKRGKGTGGAAPLVASNLRKGTVWSRPNRGVATRNARDLEIEDAAASRHTTESVRAALERKAAIYDKLKKGQTGGLSDVQYDALLVDFDSKLDDYSSDSDDIDESLTVPKPPDDDDDRLVEYEDEFGRTRMARRSEVPRDLRPDAQAEKTEVDPFVIENPVNHFPVYEPSAERVEAIKEAASEESNPLATHYDASREVRAKGAAFYSFSKDEEERSRQMEELRAAREETERTRRGTGAADTRVGEVEGMVEGANGGDGKGGKDGVSVPKSRAMEKRKREIEERRALIEAKRRKMKEARGETVPEVEPMKHPEKDEARIVEPFAAVEATVQKNAKVGSGKGRSRWDQTKQPQGNAADEFLAQLEKDLVRGR